MTVHDIDPSYQKDAWIVHWGNLRDNESLLFETIHKRKDGTIFPVEISANFICYDNKEYNFAFVRDITDRKHADQEVRLAATTFESQEGIIITDADEIILRVNKAFTKITGYAIEEVVGNKPSMFKSGLHDADFYHEMHETLKTNGFWQGEIWDRHKDGHPFPKSLTISAVMDISGKVSHYVASFSDISERKAAEERIHSLVYYDMLSKLPNRRLLIDRLEHALSASTRSGQFGALLYLDLDNFKHLNDTKGHHYGDLLLIEVAKRLIGCVREADTVARFGGDEFIVMLENISLNNSSAASYANEISNKIIATLNEKFTLDGCEHHTSSSIGITLFRGNESKQEILLIEADMAMYEAKKSGRNTQRFFDPIMQKTLDIRVELETALRQALPKQEFKLFYQIQVDDQAQPVGVEALIRWEHPERGLIPPVEFIPLAEETRLILPIGRWVLETACAQLKLWEKMDITKELSIAINISALQFQQDNFVEEIHSIASGYGIHSDKLKLELTESIILENLQDAISKMELLRSLGYILSMDDFGTGYSSLSYLKRLPFHQIKIDRSFIMHALENVNDAFIIQMVTSMAKQFGMDVIAEGVESGSQGELLLSLGCKSFQGYFFGKPMPIEQLDISLIRMSGS
jgi:diguanylate cyclase (GGDEF)-like protein/PAS domain S-box-containing protein